VEGNAAEARSFWRRGATHLLPPFERRIVCISCLLFPERVEEGPEERIRSSVLWEEEPLFPEWWIVPLFPCSS
jgi:hypothetical protein